MPRTRRLSVGGLCFHAINRGNRRSRVFHDFEDYRQFMDLVSKASQRVSMRVLGWCVMPNHFHFVLWPHEDGDLSVWMQWLLTSHVRRYHRRYETSGRVWQGRFKAFAIEQDTHLLRVLRYVERNPLRAGLVQQAEDWRWSSLPTWTQDDLPPFWDPGPIPRPDNWGAWVNEPLNEADLERVRLSVNRQRPYGSESWTLETAQRLDLMWTLRGRGRPRHD